MVKKDHIIREIQRTARENGGEPLGRSRFVDETGIPQSAWYGKHWARWGDALREAGFKPNRLQGAFSDEFVIDKLIEFIQDIGHFPVAGELRMRAKEDETFPSHNVFERVGRKRERIAKVLKRCEELGGLEDVRAACHAVLPKSEARVETTPRGTVETGFVYLMKSGRYYKIGYSNSPGRREYELALQLPEEVTQIHTIETDDPEGIEAYWHNRFASQRVRGEWFDLTASDIRAFRRRRTM